MKWIDEATNVAVTEFGTDGIISIRTLVQCVMLGTIKKAIDIAEAEKVPGDNLLHEDACHNLACDEIIKALKELI